MNKLKFVPYKTLFIDVNSESNNLGFIDYETLLFYPSDSALQVGIELLHMEEIVKFIKTRISAD